MQHKYGSSGEYQSKYNDIYPSIEDLKAKAKTRMPFFAWEFLDSGTGREQLAARNISQLSSIQMVPKFLDGARDVSLETEMMGQTHSVPFGIAPIGMTGLMWPNGERYLAKTAARYNFPYCLSTAACAAPETIGPLCDGKGWFQLYVPADRKICADMLERAWESGFRTMMVTADVPIPSMRERQRKAGMRVPPSIDLKTIMRVAMRPRWALATLKNGSPRLKMLEKYAESGDLVDVSSFMGRQMNDVLNLDYIQAIRKMWKGKMIVKGILHVDDAVALTEIGVDGILVSNHGGRQFDGAPAAIDVLPEIAQAVDGKCSVLFDSGVRTGLDVLRALALGADFVLLGRAFIYGVAALGEKGGDHVYNILKEDITNNLKQLGVRRLSELKGCLR